MKKIICSLVLISWAMVSIQAQDPQKRMRQHRQTHHEQLNLTEEQKQKAKTLHETLRKNMMDLRKNEDITVKEWKSRMEALRKNHRESMQELLSKEQKERIEKMKLERRKMAEINEKARMEKMKLRLDLTREQSALLEKHRAERKKIMETLREGQPADRVKKREAMKTLLQQQREEMKSILNEDQKKRLEQMRKPRHRSGGKLS